MIQGYGDNLDRQRALLRPLANYVQAATAAANGTATIQGELVDLPTWTDAQWDPKSPAAPWWNYAGGDKSASTVAMMSRFWRLSQLRTAAGREALTEAMIRVLEAQPVGDRGFGVMIPKGKANVVPLPF